MRAGGGHAKGAEFERKFAKELSRWASHGDRDDVFWRTPGSGSRATRVPAVAHGGDICATHEIGRAFCEHVLVECKCYKKIDWRLLLMDRKGEFYAFWTKLVKEAHDQHKIPLIVLKENGRPVVLGTVCGEFNPILGTRAPLVNSCIGMSVYKQEALLEQAYELVCTRLRSSA